MRSFKAQFQKIFESTDECKSGHPFPPVGCLSYNRCTHFLSLLVLSFQFGAELAFVKGEGVGAGSQHLWLGLMLHSLTSYNLPAFSCNFSKCAHKAFASLSAWRIVVLLQTHSLSPGCCLDIRGWSDMAS